MEKGFGGGYRLPALWAIAALCIAGGYPLGLTPAIAQAATRGTVAVRTLSHDVHSASRSSVVISNVQVSHDHFAAHSEPAVAENPRNPNNLVAASKFFSDVKNYRFKIGTYYSTNGGRSWHDSGLLPGFDEYHTVSDVSIAFSPDGVAYVSVLACDGLICPGTGNRAGIFVSRSDNGGKSFSKPVPVFVDNSGATFSDKPWIAVDASRGAGRGNVYVAWNLDSLGDPRGCTQADLAEQAPPKPLTEQGGIVLSRSTDGGKTFSPYSTLYPFTPSQSGIGAVPVVGPSGRVSVLFSSIDCGTGKIGNLDFVTSVDFGQTFSTPKAAVQDVDALPTHLGKATFRNATLPAFAASPVDGSLVVAWSDIRHGSADIFTSRSGPKGKSWSKPVQINDDSVKSGTDQIQPALAVSPNGTFSCSWFRYKQHSRLIDVMIAQSFDAGRTFGTSIRVTRKAWNPAIDAPEPEGKSSNTFIGDYQALTADNSTVHPVWNDTQDGSSQQIRTAVMSVGLFVRR